ncbi:MAG: PilZ domain-containing protein [Thermodesulfobacteriota bacterium]
MTLHHRKHERVNSLNLLSYSCFNDARETVAQGMGRTLNVSEGGILLETHVQIEPQYAVCLSIGFQEEVTDVMGKIVYSKKGDNDRWQSGIEFLNPDADARRIIKKYIEAFTRHQTASDKTE